MIVNFEELKACDFRIGDVDAIKKILATNFRIGAQIRTITACQRNSVCPHGLIDTKEIADEFNWCYGERSIPRRFKFRIRSCKRRLKF